MLFEKYAVPVFDDGATVLELGPDGKPSTFQKLTEARQLNWETIEISNSRCDPTYLISDPYQFPIEDNRYDIVISANVIEHVPYVWRWMKEVSRVCKTGGLVITINPVTWPFHEGPVDCWRIYPDGMKALSDDAGMDIVVSKWESVEIETFTTWLPERLRRKKIGFQRISSFLGLVGEALRTDFRGSFDTITIAKKR
jgi:SAM-dependent methyltransferase